jgi:hypothetical protein
MKGMSEAKASMPQGGGDFIRHVRLYDDQESAVIRFLTEADEVFYGPFHRIRKVSNKGVQWYDTEFCVEELGKPCPVCREEDSSPSTMFLAWVYQYRQFLAQDGDKRTSVKHNGIMRFAEETSEPRLLKCSVMHTSTIEMRLARYGTLNDRDYEWIRTGPRGTTRPIYVLEPTEGAAVGPLSAELLKMKKSLPTLTDVALKKVQTIDGKERAPQGRPRVVDTTAREMLSEPVAPVVEAEEKIEETPDSFYDDPFKGADY